MNLANSILSTNIKNESILDQEDLIYLNTLQCKLDEQLISLEEHEKYIKQVEDMHLVNMPQKKLFYSLTDSVDVSYKIEVIKANMKELHHKFISSVFSAYSQYLNDKYKIRLLIQEDVITSLYRIKDLKEELLPHYDKQLDNLLLSEAGIELCKSDFRSIIDYQNRLVIKDKSIKFDFTMFNTSWDYSDKNYIISYYEPKTPPLFRALSLFEEGSVKMSDIFIGFPISPRDELEFKTYKVNSKNSRITAVRYLKTDNRIEVKFRSKRDTEEFIKMFDILSLPPNWRNAQYLKYNK